MFSHGALRTKDRKQTPFPSIVTSSRPSFDGSTRRRAVLDYLSRKPGVYTTWIGETAGRRVAASASTCLPTTTVTCFIVSRIFAIKSVFIVGFMLSRRVHDTIKRKCNDKSFFQPSSRWSWSRLSLDHPYKFMPLVFDTCILKSFVENEKKKQRKKETKNRSLATFIDKESSSSWEGFNGTVEQWSWCTVYGKYLLS